MTHVFDTPEVESGFQSTIGIVESAALRMDIVKIEKTIDRLLTALISKGVISPDQADTISTGIPKH